MFRGVLAALAAVRAEANQALTNQALGSRTPRRVLVWSS